MQVVKACLCRRRAGVLLAGQNEGHDAARGGCLWRGESRSPVLSGLPARMCIRGRLARARWAHCRCQAALVDLKRDTAQRVDLGVGPPRRLGTSRADTTTGNLVATSCAPERGSGRPVCEPYFVRHAVHAVPARQFEWPGMGEGAVEVTAPSRYERWLQRVGTAAASAVGLDAFAVARGWRVVRIISAVPPPAMRSPRSSPAIA
jgi:hypothetical protein